LNTANPVIGTTIAAWDDELVEAPRPVRHPLRPARRRPIDTVDPDSPGYTLRDLITDAVGVLNRWHDGDISCQSRL